MKISYFLNFTLKLKYTKIIKLANSNKTCNSSKVVLKKNSRKKDNMKINNIEKSLTLITKYHL